MENSPKIGNSVKEFISPHFLLALAAALCSFQIAARAQTAEPKNVEIGVEQRVRNENWNNLFDFNDALDDQRNQVRYRTRFWAKVPVTSKIDVGGGAHSRDQPDCRAALPVALSTRSSSRRRIWIFATCS